MNGIPGLKRTRTLLVGSALAAAFAVVAQTSFGQSKPHFAGNWNFNKDQSDDANQKIHDAQAQTRSQAGGYPGGGYPGGGYPGGSYPGGGYPGGGGVGFPGAEAEWVEWAVGWVAVGAGWVAPKLRGCRAQIWNRWLQRPSR